MSMLVKSRLKCHRLSMRRWRGERPTSHRRNHPPPGVQFLRRKLLKFLPSKWGRWSNKFPNQRPWAAGFQIVGSYSWNLLHRSYIFFFEVVKLLKVWAATIVSWFRISWRCDYWHSSALPFPFSDLLDEKMLVLPDRKSPFFTVVEIICTAPGKNRR